MKMYNLGAVFSFSLMLVACGGSSSSSSGNNAVNTVPVTVNVSNLTLTAGVPTTIVHKLPAAPEPFNDVRIDLVKTLEAANLTVNP